MTVTFTVPNIHGIYVEDSGTLEFSTNHPYKVVSWQQYNRLDDLTYYGLVVSTSHGDAFTVAEESEVSFGN